MPSRRSMLLVAIPGALILVLILVALSFTVYTLPNHGGPSYGDVQGVLRAALGDQPAAVPGPPASLPVQAVQLPESAAPPFGHGISAPPRIDSAADAWLARAVDEDPAAVRAWLGVAVLSVSTSVGDTARTTLWRLTIHHGCPLVSRMHATVVGRYTDSTRVVRLTANCPGVGST